MSRAERREKAERELAFAQDEFRRSLIEGLREAVQGSWGIFGRNDVAWPAGKSKRREALLEAAGDIEERRSALGYVDGFPIAERFRAFSAMRGPNDPGEPKLAAAFLEELGAS